jgi:hypothetical protein
MGPSGFSTLLALDPLSHFFGLRLPRPLQYRPLLFGLTTFLVFCLVPTMCPEICQISSDTRFYPKLFKVAMLVLTLVR